jgi:hypothetical protein
MKAVRRKTWKYAQRVLTSIELEFPTSPQWSMTSRFFWLFSLTRGNESDKGQTAQGRGGLWQIII